MQATKRETAVSPRKQRSLRDYIILVIKGICMGASDIVPGVSGGTMAFILGIYEELIDSIRAVGQPEFIQKVLKFKIKEIFDYVNWPFLLALVTGIGLAIVTLSSGLEWLLLNQAVYLWAFFFGLVLASVYTVSKRIKNWSMPLWALMIVGAIGAYILVGLVPLQTPNSWWFLSISGALAICAMILPGISGAFILVLLGKYQFILNAVNNRDIVSIIFVGIGAVIGLVTFAQIIGYFFKKYHDYTVAVLIGLMVGSLRKIWPWKLDTDWLVDSLGNFVLDSEGHQIVTKQLNQLPDFSSGAGVTQFVIALGLAVAGFAVILVIDRMAGGLEE